MPHLLCYQGIAVPMIGFALAAADLQHPLLLQDQGLYRFLRIQGQKFFFGPPING